MKNITYLFGAGASAQAMPTVYELPIALEVASDYFAWLNKILETNRPQNLQAAEQQILHEYKGLHEQINRMEETVCALRELVKSHASIDTLFKKLFLAESERIDVDINDRKISFLKDEILSVYNFILLFWEFSVYNLITFKNQYKKTIKDEDGGNIKNPSWAYLNSKIELDLRYDAFLATILKKTSEGLRLPENVKIVTWNYDLQLERSMLNFIPQKDWQYIYESLGLYCDINGNGNQFFKLNGSSYLSRNKQSGFTIDVGNLLLYGIDVLFKRFLITVTFRDGYNEYNWNKNLFFNWDEDILGIRSKCFDSIQNTHVLVIVGYSFPPFNRETDRLIYENMPQLQTIYIQNQKDKTDEVVSNFRSIILESERFESNIIFKDVIIPKVKVETIPFTSQFFIPPEFS